MDKLEDTYRARGLRKQLVSEVKKKGIKDSNVLNAIGKIPRHYFFDSIFLEHAYEDKAFPIGQGQTISQPYTVAFQSELLKIVPGSKILEIGTGSGYQACVLVELGADVYSIEYNEVLYRNTARFLPRIGYHPNLFLGDGSNGLQKYAPYDGILVTAGAPGIPKVLISQLAINGTLVIPVGDRKTQKMVQLIKQGENKITRRDYNNFSFVPLLGNEGWKNE
jgi:protein-L-isoaspartate(D-aspartate) O-methyltransferase